MTKRFLLLMLLLSTQVMAKELPSWGMTETQYKMPNFITKMKDIGNQAVNNDWLLKITAPKDWHSKIRAALSEQGKKNVQINFNDSLYKSISITATPGMSLKTTTTETKQPDVVKKQVVIEKPEMDTEIEAPEFEHDFKANDILSDIEEIDLALPTNGKSKNKSVVSKKEQANDNAPSEKQVTTNKPESIETAGSDEQDSNKLTLKENLRIRHARGKTVDKSISYAHITDKDDLYVEDGVVLVKRYVNRGVAVYYWMTEDYDPSTHHLIERGSGKYVKSDNGGQNTPQSKPNEVVAQKPESNVEEGSNGFFEFVAVVDSRDDQDSLRQKFIRNKTVSNTITASQLKNKDILYVSNQTILVERPLGNSRSTYFWLEGDTDIQQNIEHTGPQKFVIQ